MEVKNLKFIHFLTAALSIELFMLFLFRFTRSPFTGISINNWYTNFGWSAAVSYTHLTLPTTPYV